jgi:type IV pilus assembly protein PilN
LSLRRINLLPPEERRRRAAGPAASRSTLIGILLGAAGLAVLLMVGLYLFYFVRLGNERDQISTLQGENQRLQGEVAQLAPFRDLQARLDAKKPIADGIWRTRFPWDEFLQGLSFVIPDTTALNDFVAVASPVDVNAPPVGEGEVRNLEPTGSITFSGVALPEYRNVSTFIVRMNNLRFLANADLDTAELDRETFVNDAITFEVTAELVTPVGIDGNEVPLNEQQQPPTGEGPTGGTQGDQAAGAGQYAAQYGGGQYGGAQ